MRRSTLRRLSRSAAVTTAVWVAACYLWRAAGLTFAADVAARTAAVSWAASALAAGAARWAAESD